ncbi:MAG TPA: DUF1232 domain-containing protein [Terriglobales bacterium]|nr:DUF1232 domain-containing protein [Terriglobales bacterium]
MSLNYIRIFRVLKALLRDSQSFRTDDQRSQKLAEDALAKAESNRNALARVWDDVTALVRLIKAWAQGRYRSIPWRSVSLAIAALLYLLSPLDGLPDFIPGLGLLDDVFIVTWVIRAIQKELDKFKMWEANAA